MNRYYIQVEWPELSPEGFELLNQGTMIASNYNDAAFCAIACSYDLFILDTKPPSINLNYLDDIDIREIQVFDSNYDFIYN